MPQAASLTCGDSGSLLTGQGARQTHSTELPKGALTQQELAGGLPRAGRMERTESQSPEVHHVRGRGTEL